VIGIYLIFAQKNATLFSFGSREARLLLTFGNWPKWSLQTDFMQTKEGCNRGVACSLLKLGSLEKTVIASLFHSGLHSGSTVRSRFKKARFKKESQFKKDCCYNRFFST
jgi:hypothetical protein